MPTPLTFPYSTLRARAFQADLVAQVVSGGVTSTGQQQRVNTTGGGLWALKLDFPRFSTADQLRSWRVIQFGSQGGVVPVNVAICDLRQAPLPSTFGTGGGVTHSDDTPFSDGSLYSSPNIIASVVDDAALRATTIRVEFDGDGVPLGGEFFSLGYGDDRHELHVVTSVSLVEGTIYDLTFVPPLRAAHVAGETVNFDHPTCTYVLAAPDSMSMATEYGRWGNGTATFIEYLG